MFKEHYPKAQIESWKNETVEEALARGIQIEKVAINAKKSKKKTKTFDPKEFLARAIKAGKEIKARKFLETNGITID